MEILKIDVLGVAISDLDQDRARKFLFEAIENGKRGYVTVTGVHGVMEAQRDPRLIEIFDRALLVTPDGMPMVWMGKLQKHPSIQRVYGPDLMLNICAHSVRRGYSHFLYGGHGGVANELKRQLEKRFTGLNIVGTYEPPFRALNESELNDLKEQVRVARPDFFWVGLSTPKQEFFMSTHMPILQEAKIFVGVGAAFDLLTGRVPQAPRWIQRWGLEWLFRLLQEPRRLSKRYLLNNPLFIYRAAAQIVRRRK